MPKVMTLKGRQIDISALRENHGAAVAIGNANMNARGDIVGKGGEIVKTQVEIDRAYHAHNPKAVIAAPVSLRDLTDEILMTPAEAVAALEAQHKALKPTRRKTKETED